MSRYVLVEDDQPRYVIEDAPAAVDAGKALNSIPRQIGLTARYGLEGLGKMVEIGSEPIRYLTDRLTGSTGTTVPAGALASRAADALGLPSPQNANERVVAEGARMLAGAGGLGAAGRAASAIPGAVGEAGRFLSSNMGAQLGAAAGAGLGGGASKEAGGSELQQAGAALVGGILGGGIADAAGATGNAAKRLLTRPSPQQVDQQINVILQRAEQAGGSSFDFSALPAAVQRTVRADVADAMRTGRELDPAAVRRLVDFRLTGVTPTRGMVSQNPVQITKEMNLAKLGANSSDEGLQGLALLQNRNNETLIRNLNEQGALRGSVEQAGATVNNAIIGRQADLRAAEQAAWNQARSLPGYRQPVQAGVLSDINRALDEEGLMPFMNPTISRYMEAFQTGQPFTPQAYRNLQSMLSNELQKGGNEAAAARIARNALERAELSPVAQVGGAAPQQAIDAVNQARQATRAAYAYEDANPLVRTVLSGGTASDPARVAQRFVIGGTPTEAATLAQEVGPSGRGVIRDALVNHLKTKALNGAADEVGKFSQSAYNKALREIGQQKLSLFFTPEEITQLQALGRVASYAQSQPVGSAVNNSNSGALLLGKGYDALMGLANKVPVIGPNLVPPIRNIEISMRGQQAQNVAPALAQPLLREPVIGRSLLFPALMSGSLASE